MKYTIAVSMRVTEAYGYKELRDSIAHDWPVYLKKAFPNSTYIFIPNIGEKVVDYLDDLKINLIFLSGGDDIGVYPLRDETELEIIRYSLKKNIPLIGICRGLQLVNMFLGGELVPLNKKDNLLHKANKHIIKYNNKEFLVNSFHSNVVNEKLLHKDIKVLAKCKLDQSIEAFKYKNILALMWHPEREEFNEEWEKNIIYNHIDEKGN